MKKINIPKFYYHKKTLYIDKETYNRDVMKVKEYKEEQLNKQKEVLDKIKEYCLYQLEYLEIKKKSIMEILTPENGYLKTDIEIEMQKYKDILELLEEIK